MKRRTNFNIYKEWKRFGKRMNALMKVKDYRGMATTYYESADFIERYGKEAGDVRDMGYRMLFKAQMKQLEYMREFDPQLKLKVVAAEDACATCKRQNGKTISLKEAQAQRVLPAKGCECKHGCRCIYAPQPEARHNSEWIKAIYH